MARPKIDDRTRKHANVYLDEVLWDWLGQAAKRARRSKSAHLEWILDQARAAENEDGVAA